MPVGTPAMDTAGTEYPGANLKNLGYARLHFFRGLALMLDFLNSDPEGKIQVLDKLSFSEPAWMYTYFNETNTAFNPQIALPYPRFADTNFNTTRKPIQTAAYLYGNILNRYGLANIALAERLWRAAFFGKSGPAIRDEMLAKAASELRRTVHAQFLASLPLAATLNDGNATDEFGNVTENDYQTVRLNQVRPTVAAAVNLLDRINRREAPKLDSLELNVSDEELNTQIRNTAAVLMSLNQAYDDAKTQVNKLETANVLKALDIQKLRDQYELEMKQITGDSLNPALPPYNGLTTPELRDKYKQDVEAAFNQRMTNELLSPLLADGSDLGTAALGVLRAFNDVRAAQLEIDEIPQRIQGVLKDNAELSAVITLSGQQFSVIDIAIGLSRAYVPDVHLTGLSSGTVIHPAEDAIGRLNAVRELLAVDRENAINAINSRSAVRDLLLRQAELEARMPSVVAQAQLAIAELNSLHNRLLRLVDDHTFFQENTASLWYNDPSVAFEQSEAERIYQDNLNDAIIQLYSLARKLESRWVEPYQNPPIKQSGGPADPNPLSSYDDFTEPESAFVIVNNTMAKDFYRALKAWHDYMRTQRPAPAVAPNLLTTEVSLRQDLLGLADYFWNTNTLQFEIVPARRDRNIALFHAYLLRAQERIIDPANAFELEFGINAFAPRKSTASSPQGSSYLIPRGDGWWNLRLATVSARFEGLNVRQNNQIPLTFYQYGKCSTIGYFDGYTNAHVDNLALYFSDPRDTAFNWDGKQQFSPKAVVGTPEAGDTAQVSSIAMTPFCDRYIMTIESGLLGGIPVNVQNINDIKITLAWTIGAPPAYTWPIVP